MTVDLNEYKVPVFPSINDLPVAPTVSKAGNGADLINRINGLIDELTTLLNNVSSTSMNWTAKLPPSTNYAELEIYYRNVSERQIYKSVTSSNALSLSQTELMKSYRLSTSIGSNETVDSSKIISPNDVIDISEIINLCGVGYYFFIFRNSNGTLREDTASFVPYSTVRGATAYLDEFIYLYATNDNYNSSNNITIEPLIVRQVIGQVEIELITEPQVIFR